MKKISILSLFLVLMLSLFAACGGEDSVTKKYTVTVNDGTGYEIAVEDVTFTSGSASVNENTAIVFTVSILSGYTAENMEVKANDSVLTVENGKYTVTVTGDTTITVSGVVAVTTYEVTAKSGEGYTVAIEGVSLDADGKAVIAENTEIQITVTLGAAYNKSVITVKSGETEIAAVNGKYPHIVTANTEITLNGVVKNEVYVIASDHMADITVTADSSALACEDSISSDVVNTDWKHVSFNALDIRAFTKIKFYIKADTSSWIQIQDRKGLFNAAGQDLWANAAKDANGNELNDGEGHAYADSGIWHKFELIRITAGDKAGTYQLYVDGVKVENYGSGSDIVAVDARASKNLTDLQLVLNGTYHLSEVFGIEDPDYVAPTLNYAIIAENPLKIDADEKVTEDLPENSGSIEANRYTALGWGKREFKSVNLLAYTNVKFYIRSAGAFESYSGYIEIYATGGTTSYLSTPDTEWHLIEFVKDGDAMILFVDGSEQSFSCTKLEQITVCLFGTYTVTELFGAADPDYVAPKFETIANSALVGAGDAVTDDLAPDCSNSTLYEHSWAATKTHDFISLDVQKYSEIKFYVKADGWFIFNINGANNDNVSCGNNIDDVFGEWICVTLLKQADGTFSISFDDNTKIENIVIVNLNELAVNINGKAIVSDIFAIADSGFVGYSVTLPEVTGCTIIGKQLDSEGNYPSGWNYTFTVTLDNDYSESAVIVKANGVVLTAVEGVYTVTVNADIEITVENVKKNTFGFTAQNGTGFTFTDVTGATLTDGAAMVEVGTVITFKIALSEGYENSIVTVMCGETSLIALEGVYSVTVNADVTITVSGVVENSKYMISGLSGTGYTITIDGYTAVEGVVTVTDGETVTFTLSLAENYDECAAEIKVFAGETLLVINAESKYSFTVTDNTVIAVNGVVINTRLFTAASGTGYTVNVEDITLDGSGSAYVAKGSTVEFSVILDTDYSESVITVNCGETSLIAVNGIYSVTVSDAVVITVEGVEKNPIVYVSIIDNPIAKTATSVITTDLAVSYSTKTNIIAGAWAATGTAFNSLDLAPYLSVEFYYKTTNSVYFEIYNSAFTTAYYQGNSATWVKISLVKEGTTWRLYVGSVDQTGWKNYTCTNLSDIRVQLGNSGEFYVSELLGIADPDYVDPHIVAAVEQFSGFTYSASEETCLGYSTVKSITASYGNHNFCSLDILQYSQINFCVKSSGYYGMVFESVIGETNGGGAWLEIKLVKYGTDWKLSYGGTEKGTYTLENNNLSDFKFKFGDNTYLVTEIIGLPDTAVRTVINTAPFANVGEYTAATDIATGFKTSASITTTWAIYSFASVDLSAYSEVKFAVKSSGYYGMTFDGSVIDETNGGGAWLEIKLVKSGTDWNLYYGSTLKGTYTLANCNLTDFSFRFGDNSYIISELVGIVSDL